MKAIYLTFLFSCFTLLLVAQHVGFGDRSNLDQPENVIRIFLDQQGDFYPLESFPDTLMYRYDFELNKLFDENKNLYTLSGATPNYFEEAQQYIVRQLKDSIAERSKSYNRTTLLIHGFRKPFSKRLNNWDSYSWEDYNNLRGTIEKLSNKNHLFIEVYWDAMYDCCLGFKHKENKAILSLFEEEAIVQATKVGYSLRRAIPSDLDTLNIVTHSLGARVGCALTFNIDSLPPSYSTPKPNFLKLCLIAPAIPGTPIFQYFNKTSPVYLFEPQNVSVIIAKNKKDFVLKKRDPFIRVFGPGPKKHGDTTLGCNHHGSCDKVEKLFEDQWPKTNLEVLDFKSMGTCHLIRCYTRSNKFIELISELDR